MAPTDPTLFISTPPKTSSKMAVNLGISKGGLDPETKSLGISFDLLATFTFFVSNTVSKTGMDTAATEIFA